MRIFSKMLWDSAEVEVSPVALLEKSIFKNFAPENVLKDLNESDTAICRAYLRVCQSASGEASDLERESKETPNPYALANKCNISLAKLSKCSLLCASLWFIYFSHFAVHLLKEGNQLKYDCLESFLEAYDQRFLDPMHYDEKEQQSLYLMAVLSGIFLRFIPPKGSKHLYMKVLPALIEGWDAKYVCGSGQSRATADRVLIYETEGAVKPLRRNDAIREEAQITAEVADRQELPSVPGVSRHHYKRKRSSSPVETIPAQENSTCDFPDDLYHYEFNDSFWDEIDTHALTKATY
jgi:hypothetical protein